MPILENLMETMKMDAMLDTFTSLAIMTVISLIIIINLVCRNKINKKVGLMLFINCCLFNIYFNWMFPYIPIYDYHPYDWSEFYWMGQFFKWTDYFSDVEIAKIILKENLPAAMVFIGISVINVITFKKKYSLLINSIISLSLALLMIVFPLAVNIYWGGVVWIINTIAPVIIIIYFLLGYCVGNFIMRLYNSIFLDNKVMKEKS